MEREECSDARKIKNYTRIPIVACKHFKLKDLYLVAGMYLLAPYTEGETVTETDTTCKQLSALTGVKEDYIYDRFLPKLKVSGYITYITYQAGIKKRNVYTMPYPQENYRIIRKEIFDDRTLTPEEKGFVIGLYCFCVNNEFRLDLPQVHLSSALGLVKNTYKKYERALMKKEIIRTSQNSPLALIDIEHLDAKIIMHPYLGYTTWMDKVSEFIIDEDNLEIYRMALADAA